MNNYTVLMKDINGVRVKVKVQATNARKAELEAMDEEPECIVEHVKLEVGK